MAALPSDVAMICIFHVYFQEKYSRSKDNIFLMITKNRTKIQEW